MEDHWSVWFREFRFLPGLLWACGETVMVEPRTSPVRPGLVAAVVAASRVDPGVSVHPSRAPGSRTFSVLAALVMLSPIGGLLWERGARG